VSALESVRRPEADQLARGVEHHGVEGEGRRCRALQQSRLREQLQRRRCGGRGQDVDRLDALPRGLVEHRLVVQAIRRPG
jgi:hypothetical protein